MRRLVKTKELKLRLNPEDAAAVERAARLESQRRREIVGESTLLRELAMPRVRELLAAADQAA
jgi:electron transfer flavoprotein alpha/beta subunit